jgi:fructokinase
VSSSPARVVVVGEALIDRISGPHGATAHPGGSPMNVAYGLGRLGVETTLVTSLADDADGGSIREHLSGATVDVLTPGPRPARTSSAIATLAADGSARYAFDIDWDLDPFAELLPPSEILHSGSIALVLGRGGASTRAALRAVAAERFVTVDPNIRDAVIDDGDEARHLLLALLSTADVVKLSIEDARWLFGDLDADDAATRLLDAGAGLAAVTLDREGSLLAATGTRVRIAPDPVDVVDTIGAGDAYMSGLIAAVLESSRAVDGGVRALKVGDWTSAELSRLGRHASLVAGLTVARAGANPPTSDELAEARRRR